jgi:4-hydroxy-tetrahydrodipicolinate synthase
MMQLQGCYTALVTPFRDGEVDASALRALVDRQIDAGIDGIVPVGTTGESPTLSFTEHKQVIDTVIEQAAGRCCIIAGTGGNSTAEAVELTEHAKAAGADATLQVTPYYNKPTADGLYRHFATVADIGLPVVLYNVPGRTGTEIPMPAVKRLAAHQSVVAIKEAAGSTDRVTEIAEGTDLCVLSGDDSMTLPMMAVGARGVISVASNLLPGPVTELTHRVLAGDFAGAQAAHSRLYPLFKALFVETNPIPIKAALAAHGQIAEEYRLPMCRLSASAREVLNEAMAAAGCAPGGLDA